MFYFDVIRGEEAGRDDVGVHAEDALAAMREAVKRCELLRAAAEAAGKDWRDWLIVTRDDARHFMFALRLSAVIPEDFSPRAGKEKAGPGGRPVGGEELTGE